MADRKEGYGFEAYRAALSGDWYADDELLHRLLDRYAPDASAAGRARLESLGPEVAGRMRLLAEESARPENAPVLRHRDPYDRRVDEVVLPPATLEALRLAHGEVGLGAVRGDAFVHYALIYLLAQNGEAGVACSVACTDGLVRALAAALEEGDGHPAATGRAGATGAGDGAAREADAPGQPLRGALDDVLSSSAEGYAHAAQFVTEIQGGSDVPANRVRAVPDGDGYRIHGQKWFCSNINADWFLVTARPEARDEGAVGLFLVPAFVGGHRNGYTIDRLKDKLGTRELATAEVTFAGARAWQVGPPKRGLSHLLRHVLTPSRYACVLFAAGALRRAERIADEYARFREAFGRPIAEYPLVRRTLDRLARDRRTSLILSFELLRLWRRAEAEGQGGQEAVDFRILLTLAKPVLTRRATEGLHEAMMVLGGNGIEERFSPLPRLYRDSVIMETWEGPHNVLFTQAVRDMTRFGIDPGAFLERVGGGLSTGTLAQGIAEALEQQPEEAAVALSELGPAILDAVAAAHDPDGA